MAPPTHHSLPARPTAAANAAGPSRPPQPYQQQQQQQQPVHGYPYAAYPQYGQQYPGNYPSYNSLPSGGYGGYGAYPYATQSYPYNGGYQAATAEGYSYSSTYDPSVPVDSPAAQAPAPAPVAARPRPPPTAPGSKPWRNCSHPGCTFTGPGDVVETHEGDRHLMFPNGKPVERSAEEEAFARRGGPPPAIQGTSIKLDTEEEVAKWIAERRAKWPTQKRVAEKDAEDAAAIARGENPHKRKRPADPARAAEDWGREPGPEREDRGGGRGRGDRGRGRGRGRGGRGGGVERAERPRREGEAAATGANGMPVTAAPPAAPASGLVGYDSSTSASSSSSDSSLDSSDSESDSDSDQESSPAKPAAPAAPLDTRPLCKFFARNGRCKHGNKCKFRHAAGPDGADKGAEAERGPRKPKAPREPVQKRANPFARPSMLGALLANPIESTLSQLTQTIRFLCANDMLRDVEVRPGQAAEAEKERNCVVEVGAKEEDKVHLVSEIPGDVAGEETKEGEEEEAMESELAEEEEAYAAALATKAAAETASA